MSTTATVDTNEGWTFPDDNNPVPEFPTTTEPDNNWGIPPAAPSPPLSAVGQPRINDHASLHWTACYDDYCKAHRQMKDNNYYPRRGNDRRRRNHQQCDCPHAHLYELAEVIRVRHLNPRKACADWQKGKRVCPDCWFLVNLDDYHQRCQTTAQRAPLADITPPQEAPEPTEETENPHADTAAPTHATHQDEQIRLLGEIVTTIHQTVTQEARHNHGIQRLLAQTMRGQHEADQQQLQGFARTLAGIINEQQRLSQQLQNRQQPSCPVRIYRRPLAPNRPDLAGASVWTGDVLSRIWRDRLGVATGAALALATIWLFLVSAAAVVVLRA